MAKRIKGITIELEGETKGLDKALQDVNKRSSEVNKELRDVERLLKFNPGNTELVAQKQKLLGDQVEATRDKLKQLKDAEAEVQRQFENGEIGEEQYRAFQREVAETESKLQHYENQLAATQEKQKSFAEVMKESGEKVKNVGGEVKDTGSTMTKWVTGPIVGGTGALIALTKAAGDSADRILDLSAITGLSTDAIQEWQHVATVAGVEQEALTNAVEGLIRKIPQLESEGGKATEQLEKLGVSYSDLKKLSPDDQMDLLIGKLANLEDSTEANVIGSQLFGGAWKDIAPILSMGSDAIEDAKNEAHELGNVLSEDSLNDANDFRIELDKLIESFKSMGLQIGADLAPILQDTLLPLIQDSIIPAIQTFAEKIGELLEWFSNLSPETQNLILMMIGLAAALGPILMVVGNLIIVFGSIMTMLPALGAAFSVLLGPVGLVIAVIAALVAIGVALYKNWDEVVAFGKNIWTGFLDFMSGLLDKVIGAFKNALDWIDEKTNGKFKAVTDTIRDALETALDIVKRVWTFIKESFKNALAFVKALVTGDFEGMKKAVSDQMDNIKSTISDIWNSVKGFVSRTLGKVWSTVKGKFEDMKDSVKEKMESVRTSISDIWDKVMGFFEGIDLFKIGKDIIKGLINGVKDMAGDVIDSVKGVVGDAIEGAKNLLGIKSPSRVFMEIGHFTGEGLEKGLEQMGGRVKRAGERLAENTIPETPQFDPAVAGYGQVIDYDKMAMAMMRAFSQVDVTMDGRQVGRLTAPHVTTEQNRTQEVRDLFAQS